jgi:hypothetical protein
MKSLPKWAVYCLVIVLLVAGSIGTCINNFGPIYNPSPGPDGKIDPSVVWSPLEPPSNYKVPGIELPAPMEVSSGRRYITITAKCDNEVKWLVSSQNAKTPIDVLESKLTNTILVFPGKSDNNDLIVVIAYTAIENKPSNAAITFIRVQSDKPPPGPSPTPGPEPDPVDKVHVTFILDYNRMTRAITDIVNNKDLRTWLKDKGHEVHELSIKDDLEGLGLRKYVEKLIMPVLVIQTTKGNVLLATQLTSVQQVKDAVTKITGK